VTQGLTSKVAILSLAALLIGSSGGRGAAPGTGSDSTVTEPAAAVVTAATYVIQPSSRFDVRTGKAGFLGAFGHKHTIRAGSFRGQIVYDPDNVAASTVEVVVDTRSLEVVALGADQKDKPDVEEAMFEKVIHPNRHPEISFTSRVVTPIPEGVHVVGTLTLEGRTRSVAVDVALEPQGDTLRAVGEWTIEQSDFGIKPYSAAGGTIKVADKVTFDFDVVAARAAGG
jgi:polyisoprenoid-binding protein YceI